MVLLVVGFCWAHKTGEWRAIQKPIPFNKHKESRRPQYSYFRYGFDLIREAILQIAYRRKPLKIYMNQINLKTTHLSCFGAPL